MSRLLLAVPAALVIALAGCSSNDNGPPLTPNAIPEFLVTPIASATYDGVSDDLLTAGLGKAGLAGGNPAVAIAASPTVRSEERRVGKECRL